MKQLDYGFKQSDKMLSELEQRLHKEYTQAAAEMEEKANKYFQRFQKEDAKKADAYHKGEITKKEYAEWRQRKMLTGKRWADMKETLARHAVNTDKIAMSFVSDKIKDVYALNMNFGTYDIERVSGINTAFTLINQDAVKVLLKDNPQLLPSPKVDIAKDMRWNMQHINSAITQGILQGESIPKVAKRLQAVTGMDERAAIRNARTAMTGAQNAGRFDAIKRMNERGVVVKKVWIATLDNVTRDSHVDLDGEVVDYDKTFSNGLMYPADGTGAPEEVINCRCRLGKEYDKYRTDWSDMRNRRDDKIKDMGYEEWKKQARDRLETKGKAAKKVEQNIKNKIEEITETVIHTEIYKKIVDNIVKSGKIDYRKVEDLQGSLTDNEIIAKISGGDLTKGSCSSLSYAYIGNKCGYDVTDYRDGDSRLFFARTINEKDIRQLGGIDCQTYKVKKEASEVAKKLKELDLPKGKEYRLSCGKHAAIIRNTDKGYEYLELQSSYSNGWKSFEEKVSRRWARNEQGELYIKETVEPCKMWETLHDRFGCRKTVDKIKMGYGNDIVFEKEMELTAVDSYKGNEEFKDILGYLNTAPDKQHKGAKGYAK